MTKEEFIARMKSLMGDYTMLDLNPQEKVEVAEVLVRELDWIRFRAGMDKECFACRHKNSPDAKRCVACNEVIICDACSGKSNAWRCSHATGFDLPKIERMAKRPREDESAPQETRERLPKREKFSF